MIAGKISYLCIDILNWKFIFSLIIVLLFYFFFIFLSFLSFFPFKLFPFAYWTFFYAFTTLSFLSSIVLKPFYLNLFYFILFFSYYWNILGFCHIFLFLFVNFLFHVSYNLKLKFSLLRCLYHGYLSFAFFELSLKIS